MYENKVTIKDNKTDDQTLLAKVSVKALLIDGGLLDTSIL